MRFCMVPVALVSFSPTARESLSVLLLLFLSPRRTIALRIRAIQIKTYPTGSGWSYSGWLLEPNARLKRR